MFMRFVQLGIKSDAAQAFERFYEHRVAPALLSEDGCVFARLIKATDSDTEFISFTLWESPEGALEYEQSGRYKSLVSENAPFQEESTEWKIQLTPDNTLEYLPVHEEPEVKAMPVVAGSSESDMPDKITCHTYVRILNAKVNSDQFDELSALYNNELVPELLAIPGCRAANVHLEDRPCGAGHVSGAGPGGKPAHDPDASRGVLTGSGQIRRVRPVRF